MRKKKHGDERILACAELLIEAPETLKDDPKKPFSDKEKPLCLEIGCGKGNFAVGTTAKEHDINLIAMERVRDVCCLALEKAMACKDSRPDNLRFIIGNADNLEDWFPEKCLDRIYLNFSDPWPKAGHAKRRLTHRNYLSKYKKLLKDGGLLIFKTDNVGLFDFSLEEFAEFGLAVEWMTRDLHNSDRAEGNVMTEYEKNFSEKGFTINSAIVRF
ncbi:MAG: tRNA (guanosine(46)-N7)-methyltransferase TrmB [Clostridia bacterium]|nr:tRNA (guanosine(46)-N7)-methyltransferase TrmB [Clostridia bacterium]